MPKILEISEHSNKTKKEIDSHIKIHYIVISLLGKPQEKTLPDS